MHGRRGSARPKICLRGGHVLSTCHYVEVKEDHVLLDITQKQDEIGHVFYVFHHVFGVSIITDFR